MREHPAAQHPDLVVGTATSDDAGVFRLASGELMVQTVDFFTPVVDDPRDWGRIAAANALSDIYAMGARPMTALQLIGWPRDELSFELLGEVVAGGLDVMAEAGCTVIGGHSIDDREPKYGFSVTGIATRVVTNSGARPGDRLIITKPIGTGIIATAIKRGDCPEAVAAGAVASMASLNKAAADVMAPVAHAATDVTGFGLLGHLAEIMGASGVGARLEVSKVPVLPGARELLASGAFPGGSARNLEAVAGLIEGDITEARLLADAQTSGGLLIAVGADEAEALLAALQAAGVVNAAEIGEVTSGGRITLV